MPLIRMPKGLIITGDVSIEPSKSVTKKRKWCILILGPTGTGKSSFIEALAGEGQSLGISKNQLAGVTQEVTAYEVKNVMVQHDGFTVPLYLVDTPGFSDSKISELEIITKVQQWMRDQDVGMIDGVLYLSPITDTRVPGSKCRTIEMIQSLLYDEAFESVNIITTMWDSVKPQAKEHAEEKFAQLRDNVWKDAISRGATISKFYNNYDSAIRILQDHIALIKLNYAPLANGQITPVDRSAPFLYQELLDRIANAQQAKELLQQEKIQLISQPDPLLEPQVLSRLPEVKDDLSKFLGQLVAFGKPPPGFKGAPARCVYQDLLHRVNEAREEQAALKVALADLHENPNPTRQATLTGQLDLVECELAEHIKRLVEHGAPPKGYWKAMFHAVNGVSLGTILKYLVEKVL